MGVPDNLLIAGIVNQQFKFYDLSLSDLVVSARHAVAIDEKRKSFAPTLWNNIEELNASLGYLPAAQDAPYQQKWFPGTHGSVGGGGDIRGLSDFALDWVLTGARNARLELDTGADSKIFGLMPNECAPLDNVTAIKFTLTGFLMSVLPTRPRSPGPSRLSDVGDSAAARWRESAEKLPELKPYRPVTLQFVAEQLTAAAAAFSSAIASEAPRLEVGPVAPTALPQRGSHYRVVRGDTLTGLALKAYGAASKSDAILAANRGILDDANRIYVGQILYIP
jgi:nucleoid-associated protein YgaU